MKELQELARRWLTEAQTLERYSDRRGAEVCRLHAGELQGAISQHEREVLSLAQAAELSGYSVDHLRHLVSDGTIPNAGRPGSPGVRRSDLPMKPGTRSKEDNFSARAEAIRIVGAAR